MESLLLESQPEPEPIDDKTQAALDEAEASVARGEVMTWEESDEQLERDYQAWLEAQRVERAA